MKTSFMLLLCFLFSGLISAANAATNPVTSGQATSAIQAVINNSAVGDTVTFGAGTYNITSGITLKCGVNLTAATPVTPSNVILSASFTQESTDIFNFPAGCTQPTSITYLSSLHAGFLVVTSPNTGLTVDHNQVGDLKCCSSQLHSPAIYLNDPNSTNNTFITNATITNNTLGDSTSCTAPQNGMTDTDSPEDYEGTCAGIQIQTSVKNVKIWNNKIFHVGEGMHILCYGSSCSPGDNPPGPLTQGLDAEFNDFNQIHRIAWEEQPQAITGVVFKFNSIHDTFQPYFGTFGLSFACCANPASTAPYLQVLSNLVIFNTVPTPLNSCAIYGYGIEAWGTQTLYSQNLVQAATYSHTCGGGPSPGSGMAWGYGMQNGVSTFSYNNVQGQQFSQDGFIVTEGFSVPAPTLTGNVTNGTVSTVNSAAPSISPAAGALSFPATITLTDAGYNSTTAAPGGNTGIWYTTDGSTPVPGTGTAHRLDSGGTFTLNGAATVKAVGMWGAANQPTSYASGFGMVPSGVVSATYTSGGTPQVATPVITPGSETFGTPITVTVTDATSGATIYCTLDGTTPTPSSPVYTTPYTLSATTVVSCLGVKSANTNSAIASATYSYTNTLYLGNLTSDLQQGTYPNTFNDLYAVTGSSPSGYTVPSATICLGTGPVTNGKSTDVGINLAPTATTEAATPICHATYTNTSATGPGCVTVPISGCGNLPKNTAYWLWTITNDPLGPSSLGGTDCAGANCNSTVPTNNVGTYGGFFVGGTYGSYSAMPTTFSGGPGTSQPSISLNLTAVAKSISSVVLNTTPTTGVSTAVAGTSIQFVATATYSDGTTAALAASACSWTTDDSTVMTVGSNTGLVLAVGVGTTNVRAQCSGVSLDPWSVTVSAAPVTTLTQVFLVPYLTYMTQPFTPSLIGNYSDGSVGPVTTSVTWSSSNTNVATVNPTTGLITPRGIGSSNITATVGSLQALVTVIVPTSIQLRSGSNNLLGYLFQSLPTGTYTLTVNADGTVTLQH